MSAVRDPTQPGTAQVAFEVERVGWPSPDRLEVVGRWFGVRGRRFIRPTLDVDVDGEPRRLLAVLDHKPWAVAEGEEWVAAFAWQGDPVDISGSELTVGPDVAVELKPDGMLRATGRHFARRPRADVLETELAATRKTAQRLARDLHAARADQAAYMVRAAAEQEAELERVRGERATAEREAERRSAELRSELEAERDRITRLETALQKARHDLALARADVAAHREEIEAERATIAAEASKSAREDLDRLRHERDAARREAENARAERDAARRESATARGERDAAIRDRDRARQERQVLLSRVRSEGEKRVSGARDTTPTLPAPPVTEPVPLDDTVTLPTRERSARIVVVVALVVLAVVIVLLVAWAA